MILEAEIAGIKVANIIAINEQIIVNTRETSGMCNSLLNDARSNTSKKLLNWYADRKPITKPNKVEKIAIDNISLNNNFINCLFEVPSAIRIANSFLLWFIIIYMKNDIPINIAVNEII